MEQLVKNRQSRLVAMMPVRNEAKRYIHHVLEELSEYVDHVVVLDDASTDATPDICRSFPKVIVHQNPEPEFTVNESRLRSRLWQFTVETNPDWILAIDADEVFEERMKHEIDTLIDQHDYDAVEFRLFDFWNGTTHVRVDGGWNPWAKRVRMLVRYDADKSYSWPGRRLHCGRLPLELRGMLTVYQSDIRLKHFGWARPEDVRHKYDRYRSIEETDHLESVLDSPEKIKLEPWIPGKVPFRRHA